MTLAILLLSSCEQANRAEDALGEAPALSKSASTSAARTGPFGLQMGQPLSELELLEGGGEGGAYSLASVPKPMEAIESYAVIAFPETGICEIRAASKDFDSDAYGVNVKSAIDALSSAISSKYGKGKKTDACSDYNCQFFQQNLTSGTQSYMYEWSSASGAKLPTEISEIILAAMPGEFNNTYYRLDYVSNKADECKAARDKSKAAAL